MQYKHTSAREAYRPASRPLPKRCDHNAKQDRKKHEIKKQDKTQQEMSRSKNHKATQNTRESHQDQNGRQPKPAGV